MHPNDLEISNLDQDYSTIARRAMVALRESAKEYRTLAELVPQLIWKCTPDGLNIYFNQRWAEYTGLTLEESYGTGWLTPFHPEDKQRAWAAWALPMVTSGWSARGLYGGTRERKWRQGSRWRIWPNPGGRGC